MPYPLPYIALIDVGHGNSAILRDGSETILVDCGARGAGLLAFLKEEGITNINSVYLSHADQDHIGGLIALISSAEFTISTIYVNSDASKGSDLWDDMTYVLSQMSAQGKIEFVIGLSHSKENIKCGAISLNIVGPTQYLAAKGVGGLDRKDRKITSNSISASFKIIWNHDVIGYLAGDIDQIALDDLVDHKIPLEAPLLVYPHHGGKSDNANAVTFTEQLCDLTKASTVIFSIGRNKHENPRPEVVATVRAKGKNVRIACTQLSKHCTDILPKTISPHLLPIFSRGKPKFECCSGTFIIKLGASVEHFPDISSHQTFIAASATTPLCN
jgi:beta-lactamase superfamily II metal-dependent hydrolase